MSVFVIVFIALKNTMTIATSEEGVISPTFSQNYPLEKEVRGGIQAWLNTDAETMGGCCLWTCSLLLPLATFFDHPATPVQV